METMLRYRPSARFTRVARALVASWAAVILGAYFWPAQTVLDRMELYTIDWRFRVRGPQQPDPRLVIVTVDEESIRSQGRWPWPRNKIAQLIQKLQDMGTKRIIFDIFFTERDETELGAEHDAELAEATRQFGEVYHAGFAYDPEAGDVPPPVSDEVRAKAWDMVRVQTATGVAAAGALYRPRGLVMPLPELAGAAKAVGFMNVLDSGDGVFRHVLPLLRYEEHVYPALVLAAACDIMGVEPAEVQVTPGREIRLGNRATIPLDAHGRMMVDFVGGRNSYPRLSVARVLAAEPDSWLAEQLAGKIAFVAVTAPGFFDLRPSPFDTVYAGAEIQTNALDTILNNKGLPRLAPHYTALVIVLMALVFGVWLLRADTTLLCISALAIEVGYVWCGLHLFTRNGLVIDLLVPMVAAAGFSVTILVLRLLGEERRRRRAQQTLAVFIPPQLADRLMTDELLGTMRGERRVVTVLFSDLRGFTAASDRVEPEAIVELLNRYFGFMHDVIWGNEGTLDKYMGDEIMAFFNAPVAQPDHARRAIRTALEMQRVIQQRRDEWAFLGMPELAAGIGINTGVAIIGYVGSEARMQYTAIGHHVNIASRLQEFTRELGQRILISEDTYAEIGDEFETRPHGVVDIRGIGTTVGIHSVLGPKGQPDYLE